VFRPISQAPIQARPRVSDEPTPAYMYEGFHSNSSLIRETTNTYTQTYMFLSFILLYLTGKLAWKMFKKVQRNELNVWLGSLSTETDSQVFLVQSENS
jgi:hypothetical protein